VTAINWRTVATPRDRAIYDAAGYGRRVVPGRRPMLLVIDVTYGFAGHERQPIEEAVQQYPNACGEAAWDAIDAIAGLLPAARAAGRPVVYSAGFSELGLPGVGLWAAKHPRASDAPDDANDIVGELGPGPRDLVVPKTKPSLFHGTPLVDLLVREGADTLVVTGGTTSGCIRATVVDAFSYNFPVLVVEEGVFDRGEMSHAVNLFDLDQKYANVVTAAEARSYLESAATSERVGPTV
jgi:maleamate amidohydrolase